VAPFWNSTAAAEIGVTRLILRMLFVIAG